MGELIGTGTGFGAERTLTFAIAAKNLTKTAFADAARGVQNFRRQTESALGGGPGGAMSDLKEAFGRGSAFTNFAQMMKGGGAVLGLGIAAHALKSVGEEVQRVAEAYRSGATSVDQLTLSIARSIPIIGEGAQGVSSLLSAVTGINRAADAAANVGLTNAYVAARKLGDSLRLDVLLGGADEAGKKGILENKRFSDVNTAIDVARLKAAKDYEGAYRDDPRAAWEKFHALSAELDRNAEANATEHSQKLLQIEHDRLKELTSIWNATKLARIKDTGDELALQQEQIRQRFATARDNVTDEVKLAALAEQEALEMARAVVESRKKLQDEQEKMDDAERDRLERRARDNEQRKATLGHSLAAARQGILQEQGKTYEAELDRVETDFKAAMEAATTEAETQLAEANRKIGLENAGFRERMRQADKGGPGVAEGLWLENNQFTGAAQMARWDAEDRREEEKLRLQREHSNKLGEMLQGIDRLASALSDSFGIVVSP